MEQEQLDEYGLKLINNNLYIENEGTYLRNLSTSQWEEIIKQFFIIKEYKEIFSKNLDSITGFFF